MDAAVLGAVAVVLVGYLLYKLGINNEFKISVFFGRRDADCLGVLADVVLEKDLELFFGHRRKLHHSGLQLYLTAYTA